MFPQAEVNTKTVGRLPPPPPLATLVWASSCENQLDRRAQPVKLPPSLPPSQRQPAQEDQGRRDKMGGKRSLLLLLIRISTGALPLSLSDNLVKRLLPAWSGDLTA